MPDVRFNTACPMTINLRGLHEQTLNSHAPTFQLLPTAAPVGSDRCTRFQKRFAKASISIRGRLDVCLFLYVPPSCIGGARLEGTTRWTLRLATSSETKVPTMAAGSLGETRSTGTSFAASATSNDGHFIGYRAHNV